MKKVLYIVYYYPPVGGSGVQRGVKFSKYLPEQGWESIVLTASPALVKHPKDHSLMTDIPPGQKIHHCFTIDAHWLYKVFWGLRLPKVVTWIMFHILIPDAEILWLPFAKARLKRILKQETIDLVYISGPPFSPMLLGKWIKQRYKIPYVVDFRDDWSLGQSRLDNPPPARFSQIERHLEHEVLKAADHITVVNKAYKQDFLQLYRDLPADKFTVITNAYDEEDFTVSTPSPKRDSNVLHIVHPGVLFARRHPGKIWQALVDLATEGKIDPARIKIHIYGRNFASFVFRGFEDNPIIRQMVVLHAYLPHPETIQALLNADVLWLFSGPGAKSDAEMPGKLFEYLRAAKPIWAVINPQGVCAEILKDSGLAYIADNESTEDIAQRFMEIYTAWQEKQLKPEPNWPLIRSFERRETTKLLADTFNKVLGTQ